MVRPLKWPLGVKWLIVRSYNLHGLSHLSHILDPNVSVAVSAVEVAGLLSCLYEGTPLRNKTKFCSVCYCCSDKGNKKVSTRTI